MRRRWHCGWLPRAEWLGSGWQGQEGMRVGGALDVEATVCPGYSTANPRVHDAALAHVWRESGSMSIVFPRPSPLLIDLVNMYQWGVVRANEHYMKETARRAREGRHG
jgi:hypothetical protein